MGAAPGAAAGGIKGAIAGGINGCINQGLEAWKYSHEHNGKYSIEQMEVAFKKEITNKENYILGMVAGVHPGTLEALTEHIKDIKKLKHVAKVLDKINRATQKIEDIYIIADKIPGVKYVKKVISKGDEQLKKVRNIIQKANLGFITITSWNMKNLSQNRLDTQDKEIKEIFTDTSKYTMIYALQEIKSKKLARELWPNSIYWGTKKISYPFIKISKLRNVNKEHFVFLIHPIIRLFYNIWIYHQRKTVDIIHEYRDPYTLILSSEKFKIAVANVHFRPNNIQTKNRFDELKNLSGIMRKLGSIKKENIVFTGDFNIRPNQFFKLYKTGKYLGKFSEVARLLKKYDMKIAKTVKMTSIKSVYTFIGNIMNGDDISTAFKATGSTVNNKGKITSNLFDHTIANKGSKISGIIHDNFASKYKNFSKISDHLPVTFIVKITPTRRKKTKVVPITKTILQN